MLTNLGLSDSPASAWQAKATAWMVPSRGMYGKWEQPYIILYIIYYILYILYIYMGPYISSGSSVVRCLFLLQNRGHVALHSDNKHNALSGEI